MIIVNEISGQLESMVTVKMRNICIPDMPIYMVQRGKEHNQMYNPVPPEIFEVTEAVEKVSNGTHNV